MANAEWEKVYQIKGLPVKFVWRGNPYNDLKATIEGGNRDYVTVARIVASSPISQAEAEKLAGEKWRQIKKTARNANAARNAKFKVGDTAFVFDDWDSPYDGRGGTVVKVDRYVHVKFRDGKVAQFSEDELTKTTNAVRNAVDEAGRPLRQENIQGFKDADGKLIKVGDMLEDTVGTTKGQRSKVVGFKGTQIYLDTGWKISKSNAALTRIVNSRALSRNAVVQKALNAALPIGDIGVSDSTVLWRMIDGGRDEPYHDEYQSRLDRMNQGNIPDETKVVLKKYGYRFKNADTSVLRETAVNGKFKVGDKVVRQGDRPGRVWTIVRADNDHADSWWITDGIIDRTISERFLTIANSLRTTNAVVAKALNARAVCNASYSAALKAIMDAVKPYMDRRITDDTSWRYPALVISKLRDVCERAVMSAGRYDGKRPPHRVYDVECVKDGFRFSGNLIVSGLLHREDPDDVSAFDEYDMTLSLGYAGKATNARQVARNAGDPGHFTSDELSALKGAFAGLNGASFSQYPNKSREQLAVRGENGILVTVQKFAFDGKPVEFDIRGQGPRSGFGVKFASSIREAVTTVKRMLASAKRQSPYSFSKYD